jgi:hypothetical protein
MPIANRGGDLLIRPTADTCFRIRRNVRHYGAEASILYNPAAGEFHPLQRFAFRPATRVAGTAESSHFDQIPPALDKPRILLFGR